MKNPYQWLLAAILLWPATAEATPPQDVSLAYDPAAQNLRIDIEHTSRDLNDHYIRRITVQVNAGEAEAFSYQRQPAPYSFSYDLPVAAEEGDTVSVKLYCEKGGTKEISLRVAAAPDEAVTSDAMPQPEAPAPLPVEPKGSGY